ncbi:MAG: hypothetical protein K6F58_03780 [Bacteroidales bacterium]|nr:hypothetical protein [Bacteroidales bacterium]
MRFAKRDFCAVMRLGQLFIQNGDNPKNHEAFRKLVYSFKPFVPEDQIESVLNIGLLLDFETAAATISQLGEEEYEWAKNVVWEAANAEGRMNAKQEEMWDRLMEVYWDYQEPDDKGAYDAWS